MDEIISPDTVKVVKGEGMPIIDEKKPIESSLFVSELKKYISKNIVTIEN